MSALHLLALILVGLGVGLLAGTFGVGGGILAVPALGLLLHVDQHVAEGTSLAAIVPTTAWAASRYARKGLVRLGAAARVGGAALVFAFAGAHLSLALPSRVLLVLFAGFLLFLAIRSLRAGARRNALASAAGGPANVPRVDSGPRYGSGSGLTVSQFGIGSVVGLLSGLLGIGGGTVSIPALVILNGYPQQLAQGTTLAAIVLASLSGAGGYALAGRVQWLAALLLFIGASATVPIGASIAHRLPEAHLRRAFAVLLVAVAALEAAHAM